MGDTASLGFLVETERQVERHLGDIWIACRRTTAHREQIVDQMRADEARHADQPDRRRRRAAGAGALGDEGRQTRDDEHGAARQFAQPQAATISKLVVISAVLASIALAEQYFSCDM